MAKLHRLVKSDDRLNTHVFTFVVPASISAENARDIISSEFMCGNQKWNISLVKQDKHVGAFLTLKNPSPGLLVTVDYGFTLVNRGHYTANESFNETGAVFTKQNPTQGRKALIAVADLKSTTRGFLQDKDQIFIEVTVCNFKSIFEYQLQLPMTDKDRQKYPPGDIRMETGFFPFGGSEWNVTLKMTEKNPHDVRGGSSVMLKRLSNFDHYCKFKYRIHVGVIEPTPLPGQPLPPKPLHPPHPQQNKVISSNPMDSLFIDAETQDKLVLPMNIYKLTTSKGVITLKIECILATTLTLLQIPMDRNRHRALRCYDRDKQAWLFEAHMKSDRLKFYLFYGDIATVPRGCIRMMNVGVSVLPAYGNVKLVKALKSPFTKYYQQQPQDDFGLEVMTGITMKEIIDTKSIYVYDSSNTLTVQIEWGDSYLLKDTNYLMSDDIPRFQKMQMEREIRMLQKENLILEKQVHSYHTAIAHKDSKGEYDLNQVLRPNAHVNMAAGQGDQYGNPTGYPNSMPHSQQALGQGGVMHDPRDPRGMNSTVGMPHGTSQLSNTGQMNNHYSSNTQHSHQPRSDMPIRNDAVGSVYGRNDNGQMSGRYNDVGGGYHSRDGLPESRSSDMFRGGIDSMSHSSPRDGMLPVPAERGHRSRSADPAGTPHFSPMPDRRQKRNSTTGVEYADYLEGTQNRQRRVTHHDDRNRGYDGYRSDSGYRSDTMTRSNDIRHQEQYGSKENRPRPSSRSKNVSDTRSDYGDYQSERRSKTSYASDRDIDVYSERGSYSDRTDRDRGQNMLKSGKPSGRASYAGHDGEYPGLDYGNPKSQGRPSERYRQAMPPTANHRETRPRMMQNGD